MNFADAEVPMQFPGNRMVLQNTPNPKSSLILAHDGKVLYQDQDYTVDGSFILPAPRTTIVDFTHFRAWYRY